MFDGSDFGLCPREKNAQYLLCDDAYGLRCLEGGSIKARALCHLEKCLVWVGVRAFVKHLLAVHPPLCLRIVHAHAADAGLGVECSKE